MKVQSFAMKRAKDIANIPTPRSAPHLDPPDERAAVGKVLRDRSHDISTGNGMQFTDGQIRWTFRTGRAPVE
jgi:hypothetical protein